MLWCRTPMFIMAGQKKRTIYPVNFTTETNTVQLTLCLASYRRPGGPRGGWRGEGREVGGFYSCLWSSPGSRFSECLVCIRLVSARVVWSTTGFHKAFCVDLDSNRPEESVLHRISHTHSAGLLRRTSRTKALNHPWPTPLLILMSITVGLLGRNVPSSGTIPQFHHLLLDGRLPRTLVLLVSGPSHNRHNIELWDYGFNNWCEFIGQWPRSPFH